MQRYPFSSAVLTVFVVVFAGCAASTTEPDPSTMSLEEREFRPSTLTVPQGAIVAFVNNDAEAHSIAFPDGSTLNTPAGATSQRSFDEPGRFSLACALHAGMRGTVVVTA